MIQPLVPEIDDNVGFEFFDRSSIGKSKLLLLASTVFGPPRQFRRTWHTTVNALERTMALRGDALLVIDELNLFLDDTPDASKLLGLAVHQLAAGSEKARYDDPGKRNHRTLFLSSSNSPVGEVVRRIGPSRVEAVQVRMPTIPADAGQGHGVFDFLPPDCSDGAKAVDELTKFVNSHYGWAGPEFIARIQERLSDSWRRNLLVFQLRSSIAAFKRRAGVPGDDGPANRVANKFGLVYAALRLARQMRIVPTSQEGPAVLKIFRRYQAGLAREAPPSASRSALEEVCAYVERRRSKLHDLTNREYPDLTDQQLEQAAGFLRNKGGATWLLIGTSRWSAEFGSRAKPILEELAFEERLNAREGYQSQVKVRASKPKDRVYMIRID